MKLMMKSLLQSPPAALRQGITLKAVNHVVNVVVLAPISTRGPQTGNRVGGSRPCNVMVETHLKQRLVNNVFSKNRLILMIFLNSDRNPAQNQHFDTKTDPIEAKK
jgi:hypothetical protein